MEKKLTVDDFAGLLGVSVADLPVDCRELIDTFDSRYRILEGKERDERILRIIKWIESPLLKDVEEAGKERWEKDWARIRDAFIASKYDVASLVPYFVALPGVQKPIHRFRGAYIEPVDLQFEFFYYNIFRRLLFRKYLGDAKTIYEFGSGSGYNVAELAKLYPEKELHGLDWVKPPKDIVDLLGTQLGYNATGHIFNLREPDKTFALKPGSAVLAVGALEQIGTQFKDFVDYLLEQKPSIFVHVDSLLELYDENELSDYLVVKYDKRKKYLEGYIPYLRELEAQGKIEILKMQRVQLGSLYHDGYSYVIWRPK